METLTARTPEGALAWQSVATTSADGAQTVTTFDDDADGVIDRRQETTRTQQGASLRTLVRAFDQQGRLVSATTTTRYDAGRLELVELDQDGNGLPDQSQRFEILADGASATTVAVLNLDGSVRSSQRVEVSADGLRRRSGKLGKCIVGYVRTLDSGLVRVGPDTSWSLAGAVELGFRQLDGH